MLLVMQRLTNYAPRFGVILIALFRFARLPEIDESSLTDSLANQEDVKPIYKQWHTIFGFLAQFGYVGAQVSNLVIIGPRHSPCSRSQWQRLQ
jgi:fucose permease